MPLATLVLATVLTQTPMVQRQDSKPEKSNYFIFLNSVPNRLEVQKQFTKEQLQKFQEGHLANFKKLYDEKKLWFVGPLGDNGTIRGVLVVKADGKSELDSILAPDPLLSNKLLVAESHPIFADFTVVDNSNAMMALINNTLVIVKKGPNWGKHIEGLPRHILLSGEDKWRMDNKLAFVGSFDRKSDKLGVLYFHSKDLEAVKKDVGADPLVTKGVVSVEVHPQWMADWFKKS